MNFKKLLVDSLIFIFHSSSAADFYRKTILFFIAIDCDECGYDQAIDMTKNKTPLKKEEELTKYKS